MDSLSEDLASLKRETVVISVNNVVKEEYIDDYNVEEEINALENTQVKKITIKHPILKSD